MYEGSIVGGDTYSDYLAPFQVNSYSTPLLAGSTYDFYVKSATIPLDYALAGPQGLVLSGAVLSGQTISYTPTVSGIYGFGLDTYDGEPGSYTFNSGSAGVTDVDRGTIVAGDTYSDNLESRQIDGYGATLDAGVTYTLDMTSASTPLDYALVGPQGLVLSGTINAGQQITYTPTVGGGYGLAFDTDSGEAGSYTFTADSSQTSAPTQGSGISGTSPPPSDTPPMGTQAAPPPPPPPTYNVQDVTTGQTIPAYGSSFSDITSDSLSINTQVANAFIVSGTGNDIINAQGGGTNVLDDTGGAVNFEIGSTAGNNAFFLDASQNPVTWNTIANFHKGDFAVIYGIGPQNLATNAANGLGVTGYSGLTLETYQNGGAAFVTFAGHNSSELGSSLATEFGTDPSGRSFMLVVGT